MSRVGNLRNSGSPASYKRLFEEVSSVGTPAVCQLSDGLLLLYMEP